MIAAFFFVTAALLLLVGPVLSVIALVRASRRARPDFEARLRVLEGQIASLRRAVDSLIEGGAPMRAPPDAPAHPPAPEPSAAPSTPPVRSAAAPPAPRRSGFDLESMIAGRWLNRVGIVALLLAVAFFLKWAFDNDWVGPAGRVAIGLVFGAALLVYSQWLLGRGYRYFSEGIAGLGAGVLYLSLYAAWDFYALVHQAVSFAGMVAVTGALAALAVGRGSERLAFLALVGGFLIPLLLSTGEDAQVVLFTYVAVLDPWLLTLAAMRAWRTLAPAALVWTVVYFFAWYVDFYQADKLVRTCLFASLFFLLFTAMPAIRLRRGLSMRPEQIAMVLANLAWFLVALNEMLYGDHRWPLTIAVLVLAALHLAIVRLVPETERPAGRPPVSRLVFAGLALTLVTLAIPIRLEGEWISVAWAVEGAILVWAGFRSPSRLLRGAGMVLFVLMLLSLVTMDLDVTRTLWNARFATIAVAIASLATAFALSVRHRTLVASDEVSIFRAVGVVANVLAVWALSMEVWDFAGRVRFGVDHRLARQLGLSLLWTACASVLVVAGVRLAKAALRWQGLVLIGLVVCKVFLFDLSFLERGYRILSFLALGVVLLVVSFLYQRKVLADRAKGGP